MFERLACAMKHSLIRRVEVKQWRRWNFSRSFFFDKYFILSLKVENSRSVLVECWKDSNKIFDKCEVIWEDTRKEFKYIRVRVNEKKTKIPLRRNNKNKNFKFHNKIDEKCSNKFNELKYKNKKYEESDVK